MRSGADTNTATLVKTYWKTYVSCVKSVKSSERVDHDGAPAQPLVHGAPVAVAPGMIRAPESIPVQPLAFPLYTADII